LPIGILLLALLLIWLSKKEKYKISQQVIKIVLLTGAISALLTCITGYTLSTLDAYKKPLIIWHTWTGISVVITSMLLYMKQARKEFDLVYKMIMVLLLVLIVVTGHLGGTLTYGKGYLSIPPRNIDSAKTKHPVNVDAIIFPATKPVTLLQQ
jgi:FtsH-binding integral membrane protein